MKAQWNLHSPRSKAVPCTEVALFRYKLDKLVPAISLAGILILSGCHKKVQPPPPAPPPPVQPTAPTASITADPNVIQQGQSTTLKWRSTDATQVSITGISATETAGTQTVTPTDSTTYTITAKGPGGSIEESARVTVNRPVASAPIPPSLTEQQLFDQQMQDVYFDYDRYDLQPGDLTTAEHDATFLNKYPDMKIVIGGHCDDRGSAEYNLALGQSRAEAVKKALVTNGVSASRIRTISYGKEKPFCTEEDESCWHQNRRDHIELDR